MRNGNGNWSITVVGRGSERRERRAWDQSLEHFMPTLACRMNERERERERRVKKTKTERERERVKEKEKPTSEDMMKWTSKFQFLSLYPIPNSFICLLWNMNEIIC